ncbi:MAG: hypothetical protein M5R41_01775 [Bacteroidia bacterium]|nr:hypothetical protein [Bacteroidia bacterium]
MVLNASEFTFEISGCWQISPFDPNVKVIVVRGEGSNGVITVSVPHPTSPIPDPQELSVQNISNFDLIVHTSPTTATHYDMSSLETDKFLVLFSLTWPAGEVVNYRIRVNC